MLLSFHCDISSLAYVPLGSNLHHEFCLRFRDFVGLLENELGKIIGYLSFIGVLRAIRLEEEIPYFETFAVLYCYLYYFTSNFEASIMADSTTIKIKLASCCSSGNCY